jgi:peptidoglycan/xylan/chitin deacetylase (PgdA/CDA1 family)
MVIGKLKSAIKTSLPVKMLLNLLYPEQGIIFMMHRVALFEEGRLTPNENIKITPQFLDDLILGLRDNYTFITLDEFYDSFKNGRRFKKKFAIFTFDDGYSDNYNNAFPIFKKHNTPFTIYLTTGFPDKKAILWWYIIEDIILKNEEVELSDGSVYDCSGSVEKHESFFKLRNKILRLSGNYKEDFLKQLFFRYSIDFYKTVNELALSWEQIIEMSNSGLCTIAAHSVNHPTFNIISEQELHFEMSESKNLIESKISKEVLHFAYPFGTNNEVGKREFDLAEKCHYKTAALAIGGKILYNKKCALNALPRLSLTEKFTY